MTTFNINLSKGHVYAFKTRRWICRAFLIYLLVCGVFLVIVCNRAVSNLVYARQQEQRIKFLEKTFSDNQDISVGIRDYYQSLSKQLEGQATQLEFLDEKMPYQRHIAPLLVELIEPLPPEVYIQEAKYTPAESLLQFNVIIPQKIANGAFSADKLIMQWKKRPSIKNQTSSLTATLSDRTLINDQEVTVVQFRCVLKERG